MLTMFEHLEQGAARMDLERLHDAGLMLERVVMAHAIAEDRYLFDEVPKQVATTSAGLSDALVAMSAEHRQLILEFRSLGEADGEAAARGRLLRLLQELREHFEVEERVLFQAAANQISRQKLEALGLAWKRHRMKEAAS